jgi:hypothetical protein
MELPKIIERNLPYLDSSFFKCESSLVELVVGGGCAASALMICMLAYRMSTTLTEFRAAACSRLIECCNSGVFLCMYMHSKPSQEYSKDTRA